MVAVVSGLILGKGVFTYLTYFHVWAADPETYRVHDGKWAELAWTLNAQPSAADKIYLVPFGVDWNPSFEYLYQGDAPAHIVRGKMPDLAQKLRSTLAAMENLSTVRVVDWSADYSTRLAARATAAAVDADLKIWDGLWHVFHAFLKWAPEARRAIDEIGAWIDERMQTEPAGEASKQRAH